MGYTITVTYEFNKLEQRVLFLFDIIESTFFKKKNEFLILWFIVIFEWNYDFVEVLSIWMLQATWIVMV